MKTRDRLRIAIQKSGRLGEPARELLTRAGFVFRQGADRLFCRGESLPFDLLLVRDDDIPGLIAQGVGPTEIAQRLGVSVKTIETHREHIKDKLNLKNATELTRFALHWNMQHG